MAGIDAGLINILVGPKLVDDFGTQLEKGLKDDVNKAGGKSAEQFLQGFSDRTQKLGKSFSKKVTAPILGAFAGAFAAFSSIEEGISSIGRATGATGADLAAFGDNLRNVYRQVPEDISQVATVIGDLNTRIGISGDALEAVSKQVLDFARITGEDAGRSSEVLGKLLNALELDAEDASLVLDKLALASQLSGISATKLAQNILDAGPAFEELGFDLDRSIALFASFEKAGARPEEVIGSLNLAINRLAKESGKEVTELQERLSKAQKNLEKDSSALQVQELRLAELQEKRAKGGKVAESQLLAQQQKVDELRASLAENTAEVRTAETALASLGDTVKSPQEAFEAYLQEIKDAPDILSATTLASELFGSRVGAKVAEDIRAGRFEVEEWTEVIAGAAGTVDKTAKETETFTERARRLRGEIVLAAEPFGKQLIPFLDRGAEIIKDLIKSFSNLTDEQRKWIVIIAAGLAVVGPLLVIVGKLATALLAIIKVAKLVGIALGVVISIKAAIVVAIVAVVAALAILFLRNEQFRDFIKRTWEAIRQTFRTAGEAIGNAIIFVIEKAKALADFFRELPGRIGDAVSRIRNAVSERLQEVQTFFRELPGRILGFLSRLPAQMFNFGRDIIKQLLNGIRDRARNLASEIRSALSPAFSALNPLSNVRLPGFRADGGPVSAGRPYIVGERGPELIVPRRSGTVIPNEMLGAGAGGDRYEITIVNPVAEPASLTIPRALRRATYLRG